MMSRYKKFAKIKSPAGATHIWIADDHFLIVKNNGYFIERYRRYFFDDIKSVVILKTWIATAVHVVLSLITACLGAIFLYCVLSFAEETGIKMLFMVIFLMMLSITFYSILFNGRSCKVIIATSTGQDKEAFNGYYMASVKFARKVSDTVQEYRISRKIASAGSSENIVQENANAGTFE